MSIEQAKPYDPNRYGPSERQAFANGITEGVSRCVRTIERHIAFWQRAGRIPNQEMVAELQNILQELNK
jgi:hypothetical protein